MPNRRAFSTVTLILLFVTACAASAQDAAFARAYERAQAQKPARLATIARIAPEAEPGDALVINGRLFREDGTTPAAGITVFAYQTDRHGLYDAPSAGPHSWRLKGWAITDRDGRFTFHTIRPASYPNSQIAQHVHLHIEGPGIARRWTTELQFGDDPKITAAQRSASQAAGLFGGVRPVTKRNGVDHVEINLKIENRGLF